MNLWRRLRGQRTTDTLAPAPGGEVLDLGDDPLDPHGDGTIRPGDPMWEQFLSGRPTLSTRRPDGQWEVRSSKNEP